MGIAMEVRIQGVKPLSAGKRFAAILSYQAPYYEGFCRSDKKRSVVGGKMFFLL